MIDSTSVRGHVSAAGGKGGLVGMLGDLTPREAAKTASGRKKVAEWLKFIESRAANHPNDADPMATYDFSWIWRELGVEKLRK